MEIIKRAARIAPESLEALFRNSKSSSGDVRSALEALGDDPRGIAWVAADARWRSDTQALRALGRFRAREDARHLLAAWFEDPEHLRVDPQQEQEREGLLQGWLPQQPAIADASILPFLARATWIKSVRHGVTTDALKRAPAESVIRALDATRPPSVSEVGWICVQDVVSEHGTRSAAAQDFWVRWIAPRCRESESEARTFALRAERVSVASPTLAELYRSWSMADAPYLREWACRFFGRGLVPDARERLIAALRDPATEVSVAAAHELRHFDDLATVDALLAASTSEHPYLRGAAEKSLEVVRGAIEAKRFWSNVRAEGIEDPLAKILPLVRDADPELRLLAIDSLGALGSPRALPHLLELFQSGGAPEKAAAKRAIERIQRAVDAERAKPVEPGPKPAPAAEKGSAEESKKGETDAGGGGS